MAKKLNMKNLNMQKVSIIFGGNFLRGIHWDSQNLNYRVPKGPKWGFFEKKFQKKKFFSKKIFFSKKFSKFFRKFWKFLKNCHLKMQKKSIFRKNWWVTKTTWGHFFPHQNHLEGKIGKAPLQHLWYRYQFMVVVNNVIC